MTNEGIAYNIAETVQPASYFQFLFLVEMAYPHLPYCNCLTDLLGSHLLTILS